MSDAPALSAAKRALLERRLRGLAPDATDRATIPRRPDPASAPLSFMQRQMWLIEELAPGNPAYHLPYGFRLRGAIDPALLEASFNAVIARHEALRTTFVVQEGEPLQRIHASLSIVIRQVSLKHFPEKEREERLQALAAEESLAPFDLARLPLVRVSLFALEEAQHVLLLNLHHLVADGLSIELLLRELDACYRSFACGASPKLPPLEVQYGDFSHWQQASANESAYARQLEYWKSALAGVLPVLDLPADHARPARQSFRGANVFFDIAAPLATELKQLGEREGCTPFMTLLAAFQVLLWRHSAAEGIVVGTPVSLRAGGVQGLIGNFLNVLALRCDLSGDPPFLELLRKTRERTLDALSHGDLPFEMLLRHVRVERDPSRTPIFQVLLQLLPPAPASIGGLEVADFQFDRGFAQFDLALHLYEEAAGGYRGRLEYCVDLFDADRIERMAANFLELLRAILRDPRERISRLPMLSRAEQELLRQWNDTGADLGGPNLLHEAFEAQVRRTPECTALEYEGQSLTYAELNRRANRLARLLRSQGVARETLVGVLAERSFEMVASLYAVLKAGGAYVPLDPSYPPERLRNMLEDARVPVVLAQPALAGLLPEGATRVIPLDASGLASHGEFADDDLEQPLSRPDDLAYVIFTSGSTGRPKGAMNAHRAICNRLQWMQRQHRLRTDDCVLQKTPFSFDVSIWEFFCPLAAGARLAIARPDGHRDPGYLVQTVREARVTTLHFVPSMLHAFLDEPGVEDCTSLRRVICIGEALSGELQQHFFARFPGVELHNQYGPTEAAVCVTHWACRASDARATVPIGRPGPNTRIYILDAHMQPVPIGVPGELYIAGVQVGRGYVGHPELTAERFLADPFSKRGGERMYRTGDQARFLSDGSIEFLGRLDFQVKLRGQRIELGEIEATLDRHPRVKQNVVTVRAQAAAQRLVAYVVPREAPLSAKELKEHLARTLPQYMLPDDFVFLDALPLTSNGKVDRKQLPAPEAASAPQVARVAPRTRTEEIVVRAFSELLERPAVGVGDNFFELGGHSLAAARLLSKLRRASGVELPLRILFERPTAEQLAEAIDMLAWAQSAPLSGGATANSADRVEIEL